MRNVEVNTRQAIIRRATVADLSVVTTLFDQYRMFYGQPSDPADAETFLRARLTSGDAVIFLAEAAAEPKTEAAADPKTEAAADPNEAAEAKQTACGFAQLYPSFSSISMKRLWILNDLFVAPTARKAGVGKALLEGATTFAKEGGAKGLMLRTAFDNEKAQSLYEKNGWKRDEHFLTYNFNFKT